MKNYSLTKLFYIGMSLFLAAFLSLGSIYFSQDNNKQLVSKVEKKIASYYDGPFIISADKAGVVTIKGDVGTMYDKLKISELVSEVDKVSGINNEIEVHTGKTADEIIKDNIIHEFDLNNVILEPEKIKVEVKNGTVNLSGTVSYMREKIMAQTIASCQDGVTDMKSNLVVSSPSIQRSDVVLKEMINDIINKHFSLESDVKFDVSQGAVNLYGSVKSLYAKNHIQEEIQHLLGVKDISNKLNLEYSND